MRFQWVLFNVTSRHVEGLLVGRIEHRAIARNRSGQYRVLWSRSKSNLPSAADNVESTKKCQQEGDEDSDPHPGSLQSENCQPGIRKKESLRAKGFSCYSKCALVCDKPIGEIVTPGRILKDSKQDGVASCLFK